MNQKRYTVPAPVGNLLSLLPSYPGSLLFVTVLNLVTQSSLPEDVEQAVFGKQLRLRVADVQMDFDFLWSKGGFVPAWNRGQPDLTISATAHDFLLLARRLEDPDTLFFNRRLSMEGDTELGLLVKNTLDSLEWNPRELMRTVPLQLLSRIWPGK